jgi:hypothetical protein
MMPARDIVDAVSAAGMVESISNLFSRGSDYVAGKRHTRQRRYLHCGIA